MFLVLRNPQFRLLWISIALNDVGMILFVMVHGWLTLTITNSPFWVGAAVGMNGLGLFSFSMFSGVLVDRLDRRKLAAVGLLAQGVMAFILVALIFTDNIHLWHVLVVAFFDGVMVSVKVPSRMALTLDVVGRERLLSATAANFSAMTIMGIVVPLFGGFVISTLDIGWAYVIVGGAYVMSALVILGMGQVYRVERAQQASPWQDFKLGVRYVFGTPTVRTLIILAIIGETFAWSHEIILPVMARDELEVGASGLGYLLSVGSAGAAIATLIVSNVGDFKEKGKLLIFGYGVFGLFLMLFAASPWFSLSMVLLAFAYASAMAYEVTLETLLQTVVPDEMRGRVLSFQVFTWGFTGIAGFYVGAIAALLGAPIAIVVGGGVVFLVAVGLARRVARLQEPQTELATEG